MNRKNKILIVEDNESIRILLETRLVRSGFDVICTDNVVDGIKRFNAETFDLVMTDICLPGLSGNILARYVRNLRADIPIISVTASPWLVDELFDMVIEKPFELTFLLDTIAYYLPSETNMPAEHALQICV